MTEDLFNLGQLQVLRAWPQLRNALNGKPDWGLWLNRCPGFADWQRPSRSEVKDSGTRAGACVRRTGLRVARLLDAVTVGAAASRARRGALEILELAPRRLTQNAALGSRIRDAHVAGARHGRTARVARTRVLAVLVGLTRSRATFTGPRTADAVARTEAADAVVAVGDGLLLSLLQVGV